MTGRLNHAKQKRLARLRQAVRDTAGLFDVRPPRPKVGPGNWRTDDGQEHPVEVAKLCQCACAMCEDGDDDETA